MALVEITQGTGFWKSFRPNYQALTLSDITDDLELLADKFIQLPDRSIYYVHSDGTYFLAFDQYGRPAFITNILGAISNKPIRLVDETATASTADHTILCDATDSAFTVNLPDATENEGKFLCIKKIDATGNVVTIDASGDQLIDGSEEQTLDAPMEAIWVQAFDGNWYILAVN